jgi:hypothetical protein
MEYLQDFKRYLRAVSYKYFAGRKAEAEHEEET